MTWDPKRPIPPDDGAGHSHPASKIEISAAMAGPDNDIPEGEWRVLLNLSCPVPLPANHRLSWVMTFAKAQELAEALIQAAGDVGSRRVDEITG